MSDIFSVSVFVIGAILTIIGAFDRYRNISATIEALISYWTKLLRPSAFEESITSISKESKYVAIVLAVISFIGHILAYNHSPLVEINFFKFSFGIAIILLEAILIIAIIIILASLLLFLLLSFLGFCLAISDVLSNKNHLAFFGIPLGLVGAVEFISQNKYSSILAAFIIIVALVILMEIKIRSTNKERPKFWYTIKSELDGLASNTFGLLKVSIYAGLCFFTYLLFGHEALWHHNEKVSWGTALPKPVRAGITITDVEFGVLENKGLLWRPTLVQHPNYKKGEINQHASIVFALKFSPKIDYFYCNFIVYHIDTLQQRTLISNDIWMYEGDLGWSVPLVYIDPKKFKKLKTGSIEVQLAVRPAKRNYVFTKVAIGKIALRKGDLLSDQDIQHVVLR